MFRTKGVVKPCDAAQADKARNRFWFIIVLILKKFLVITHSANLYCFMMPTFNYVIPHGDVNSSLRSFGLEYSAKVNSFLDFIFNYFSFV